MNKTIPWWIKKGLPNPGPKGNSGHKIDCNCFACGAKRGDSWIAGLTKETSESVRKISLKLKGRKKSKEHCISMSRARKGKCSPLQREAILKAGKIGRDKIASFRRNKTLEGIYGPERAQQIREKFRSRIPWNKNKNMWQDKPHPRGMLGKHHSLENRIKFKLDAFEKVKEQYVKTGTVFPRIGENEVEILDQLECEFNTKIERGKRILNYIVDGYSEELNIVFEVYERKHKLKEYRNRDIERMNDLMGHLQCGFIIIEDY